MKLTVSGAPGSGTTTLVSILEKRLGCSSLNGGEVFRRTAESKGISLEELSHLAKFDDSIDKVLDTELKEALKENSGPDIVESRLAGWWAYLLGLPIPRIWLNVSIEEGARRVLKREGGELEHWVERTKVRTERDWARYQSLYGLTPEDETPYSLYIESDDLNPNEIADLVIANLEMWEDSK